MSDPARLAAGTQRGVTIAVAALALLGAALVWHATTAGAGIENDSAVYAQMAVQLRSGQPVSSTHFPPGLPIVWAVAANPYAVARVLNLLALAALVAITGAAVWQSTRRPFPTLFAAAMVAVGQPLLAAHAEALSEPLMLVLASAGLWLTLVALADDRPRRAGAQRASRWGSPQSCAMPLSCIPLRQCSAFSSSAAGVAPHFSPACPRFR